MSRPFSRSRADALYRSARLVKHATDTGFGWHRLLANRCPLTGTRHGLRATRATPGGCASPPAPVAWNCLIWMMLLGVASGMGARAVGQTRPTTDVIYINTFDKRGVPGAGRNGSGAFVGRKGYGCGGVRIGTGLGASALEITLWARSEPGGQPLKAAVGATSTEGLNLGYIQDDLWAAPLTTTYHRYRFLVNLPFANTDRADLVFYRAPDQVLYVDDIVVKQTKRSLPEPRPADKVELVPNGDFEPRPAHEGLPDGWSVHPAAGVEAKVVRTADRGHVLYVKFSVPNAYLTCSRRFALEPSLTYVCECRVRGRGGRVVLGGRGVPLPDQWRVLRMPVGTDRRRAPATFRLRIVNERKQEPCECYLDGISLWRDRTHRRPLPTRAARAPSVEEFRGWFLAHAKLGQKGFAFADRRSSFEESVVADKPGVRAVWFPGPGASLGPRAGRYESGALCLAPVGERAARVDVRIPEFDGAHQYAAPGPYYVSFLARKAPGTTGSLELVLCRTLRDPRAERWRLPAIHERGWTYCEVTTTVPESLHDGFLSLSFRGKGQVWVDDFRIVSKLEVDRGRWHALAPLHQPVVVQLEGPRPIRKGR